MSANHVIDVNLDLPFKLEIDINSEKNNNGLEIIRSAQHRILFFDDNRKMIVNDTTSKQKGYSIKLKCKLCKRCSNINVDIEKEIVTFYPKLNGINHTDGCFPKIKKNFTDISMSNYPINIENKNEFSGITNITEILTRSQRNFIQTLLSTEPVHKVYMDLSTCK